MKIGQVMHRKISRGFIRGVQPLINQKILPKKKCYFGHFQGFNPFFQDQQVVKISSERLDGFEAAL